MTSYIAEWLTTFKQTTVKQSTYDRLLTSVKALEGFEIATIPIGEITCIDIQHYVNELIKRGYAAVALMIETGLQVGEALALRWKDVNINRKRLHVRSTVVRLANKKQSYVQDCAKSESSNRTIPLTPKTISSYRCWQRMRKMNGFS